MKKSFFLAFVATMCISFVIAMPVKDSCPCPIFPKIIVDIPQTQPIVKTKKVLPTALPVQRKEPGVMISGSFNTTTNNYYNTPGNINRVYTHPADTDTVMSALLAILLITAIIALVLFIIRSGKSFVQQPRVDIHNHIPSAPQSKVEHRPSDGVSEKDAMEKAVVSGGTFQKRADGSWRIDFPKPSEKTDENKKENEVR